jgi:hypothetical protein
MVLAVGIDLGLEIDVVGLEAFGRCEEPAIADGEIVDVLVADVADLAQGGEHGIGKIVERKRIEGRDPDGGRD